MALDMLQGGDADAVTVETGVGKNEDRLRIGLTKDVDRVLEGRGDDQN